MEEDYKDIIDAYERDNQGYATLTDYIKGNNIKIKDPQKMANGGIMRNMYATGDEVEEFQEDDLDTIELMKDQGIPAGEQVRAQDSGIMQMADREDPMLMEEYQKYRFEVLEMGQDPMSFEQFRDQAMSDQASIDPSVTIETIVKEFIKVKGRKPNSLDEIKEFYEMKMGSGKNPEMKMMAELVEDDKSRITLAGGSFPDLSGDGEITQEDILIGRGVIKRDDKQSGGLAAILGL